MKKIIFTFILLSVAFSFAQARDSITVAGKVYNKSSRAVIQVLNKTNGMVEQMTAQLGKVYEFEDLQYIVDECYTTPDYELPESIGFLRIAYTSPPINNNNKFTMEDLVKGIDTTILPDDFKDYSQEDPTLNTIYVFRGWMWSTYQERNSLVNPIYDVVIVKCLK